MVIDEVKVRIVIGNQKSLRALRYAAKVRCEIQEDMPWRDT